MKEEITSVGIDIGTSTTQLVFAKITLENMSSGARVPQIKIVKKEIFYRSEIHFTPLLSEKEIDAKKIKKIITNEYIKSGVKIESVKTGAVIITGETARKENANEILKALSELAGEFVVATAGPDLESVISGKGSGAMEFSSQNNVLIHHFDIGGGTTNISIFDKGEIVDTTCLDIGGRLIIFEEGILKIKYIYKKYKEIIDHLELKSLVAGKVAKEEDIRTLCKYLARLLVQNAGRENKNEFYNKIITYRDFSESNKSKNISFSGGVADFIYNEQEKNKFKYNDIGIFLGEEIRKAFEKQSVNIVKVGETIGATVIGAGSHTTKISGSTITYKTTSFPFKNIPVVRMTEEEENLSSKEFIKKISKKIEWFSNNDESQVVAIGLTGKANMSYLEIENLSSKIYNSLKKNNKVIIIIENDVGKALGQNLLLKYQKNTEVLCIDGIKVLDGDYVDIGAPLGNGHVLPIIVKTLVLNY